MVGLSALGPARARAEASENRAHLYLRSDSSSEVITAGRRHLLGRSGEIMWERLGEWLLAALDLERA